MSLKVILKMTKSKVNILRYKDGVVVVKCFNDQVVDEKPLIQRMNSLGRP